VIENAPPGNGKGRASLHTSAAQISQQHRSHHYERSVTTEIYNHRGEIKTSDDLIDAFSKHDRRLDKKPRHFAQIGSCRSRQRLREIERVLSWHYGPILPDDDAGRDDLHVLLSVCKAVGHGWDNAAGFIRKWGPWMSEADAKRAYTDANLATAYLNADAMAKRLGVTWAERQSRHLRTIGAIDLPKAEREKMRRAKHDAKRKQAKVKPAELKPREKAIMRMVGNMIGMGDLARKAARHRLFHGREDTPRQVRRIVDKLVQAGHLGKRLEPRRERGGSEWFIWRESKTKETPAPQPLPESVRCKTSIFIGSNHRTKSCVNIGEAFTKNPISTALVSESRQ
jgi:hypothetical protein